MLTVRARVRIAAVIALQPPRCSLFDSDRSTTPCLSEKRMRIIEVWRRLAFGALSVLSLAAPLLAGATGELNREVIFSEYSDQSTSNEIARRTLSPLTALELERHITSVGKTMIQQPIKLAEERFVVYVPASCPPRGCALLVFVPPWEDAQLPPGWSAALDRNGVIFVSAARSGNSQSVFDRREPLALLAAHNIRQRYPIDAQRIYIGGFSGGARVALRLALAYPDIFSGAILNAGSDEIGNAQIPIPPKELFLKFQNTHLVYATGEADTVQLGADMASMASARKWCAFDIQDHVERSVGHEVASSTTLTWALAALLHSAPSDPKRMANCTHALEEDLNSRLLAATRLMEVGRNDEAQQMLAKIDARFGGLSAPRITELAR